MFPPSNDSTWNEPTNMVLPQFCVYPTQPFFTSTRALVPDSFVMVMKSTVPGPILRKSMNPDAEAAAFMDMLTR